MYKKKKLLCRLKGREQRRSRRLVSVGNALKILATVAVTVMLTLPCIRLVLTIVGGGPGRTTTVRHTSDGGPLADGRRPVLMMASRTSGFDGAALSSRKRSKIVAASTIRSGKDFNPAYRMSVAGDRPGTDEDIPDNNVNVGDNGDDSNATADIKVADAE